jgi:tetratricopeptide (TPR) repeat protein
VDAGIRAYVEGRISDARGLLQKVLEEDPSNSRARSYMILLDGGLGAGAKPAPAPAVAAPPAAAAPPQAPVRPEVREVPEVPEVPEEAPAHTPPPGGYAPSPWDDGPASTMAVNIGSEGGMDLAAVAEKSDLRPLVPEASRPPSGPPPDDTGVWMRAAKDLHALGDFTGSLEMIEKILRVAPDHAEAREYLHQNEATLAAMYESKLGPIGGVPRLAIKPEEVMWLNLDHRAGFLLSQIDGAVDYESLFALSGLPRLDTARILATLISDGVIASS